jgi:adenylate cyclase
MIGRPDQHLHDEAGAFLREGTVAGGAREADPRPALTRGLAAILSADVSGYSRLMHEDEEATVGMLAACRELIARQVAAHGGRMVDTAGDSALAIFSSVVEALRCAVGIQRELGERNAAEPNDRRMQFRLGVHLGDILSGENAVYGDGVNLAARLEALADPGGICISGDV